MKFKTSIMNRSGFGNQNFIVPHPSLAISINNVYLKFIEIIVHRAF